MVPTINQDSASTMIRKGFTFRYVTDITRDKVPLDLSTGTLQARLITTNGDQILGSAVTLDGEETGANLAAGRVVVVLPPATTTAAPEGDVRLQIIWTDSDDNVWPFEANLPVISGGPALG